MGITERREREKNERRKAILDCTRELILQKGVEQVNMEDIAIRAELSKATIYLYYSGKDDLLNEISEEAARLFLEHFKPIQESGLIGIEALKYFWRSYVEMFGHSNEMLMIFQIRNYLNPGLPFVILEGQADTSQVGAVLETLKTIIDQCKSEGFFDPKLDSEMATRLVLSMFSNSVHIVTRMKKDSVNFSAVLDEMANAFQIVLWGFAREGMDRSLLDITNVVTPVKPPVLIYK